MDVNYDTMYFNSEFTYKKQFILRNISSHKCNSNFMKIHMKIHNDVRITFSLFTIYVEPLCTVLGIER